MIIHDHIRHAEHAHQKYDYNSRVREIQHRSFRMMAKWNRRLDVRRYGRPYEKPPVLCGGCLIVAVRRELRACLLQFALDLCPLAAAECVAGEFGAQHLDLVV
ncbi:hypothetical protein GDI0094 [Gluconacetobacter diazotrophicus PA1 5]|uniref:Uncharacterized protein n=1 Tax=Gluconacetobacter diazotrophicus (strain ATCC 49037 / DSM 5601 / CCUG 37298 / CIP 103539 / LMG 7603 / PAl5) TaxID=272568 RepID=A9H048_GLUDA|nr:hypothetical protein GDI0094 [Gluconacetobacter diazotrophicus PA1 5]